jgi:hypothetical protein
MSFRKNNGENAKATGGHRHLLTAEIVFANAIPVIGVWFLGWDALGPIFFYWLDGLFALWGLGVVAVVVTIPEVARGSKRKLWLVGTAAACLTLAILSIPSALTAGMVIASFRVDPGEFLHQVFKGHGIWFSLLFVVLAYAGQTVSELLANPALTIRQSGKERGSLFLHRTLLMGILTGGSSWGQPPQWVLADYVLAVACLYTYSQLYLERYLRLMGMHPKTRDGRDAAKKTK